MGISNNHVKGTAELYRCLDHSTGQHRSTTNANCDGLSDVTRTSLHGYISTSNTNDFPTAFRRCVNEGNGDIFDSLSSDCEGKKSVGITGYAAGQGSCAWLAAAANS